MRCVSPTVRHDSDPPGCRRVSVAGRNPPAASARQRMTRTGNLPALSGSVSGPPLYFPGAGELGRALSSRQAHSPGLRLRATWVEGNSRSLKGGVLRRVTQALRTRGSTQAADRNQAEPHRSRDGSWASCGALRMLSPFVAQETTPPGSARRRQQAAGKAWGNR